MTHVSASAQDSNTPRNSAADDAVSEHTHGDLDELLLRVEEQYLDSLLTGEALDPECLIAEHLGIADRLRRRLNLIAAMHRSAPIAFGKDVQCLGQSGHPPPDHPRKIGRFEVVGVAGNGAFGTVLKARDAALERWVAIKIPHAGFLRTAEARERFLREARTAANLRHSHIVAVHEISEENGLPYIVTDFIDGSTLADSQLRSQLSARGAAKLVVQVAEALAAAHARQIVHRDIKPGNILIDRAGEPHVTDFGLALNVSEDSTLTVEGQLLGTPAYMSPEQAAGKIDQMDPRCDVYSLGVVLYELLTGEPPFRGLPRMVIQQVLRDEPRPPRTLDDRIPRDLETICLKAMAKEPGRRFQTAQLLADDLNRYLQGEPIHSRRVSRSERVWQWCRRNPILAALDSTVATLLLMIVSLSVWGYIRESAIRAQAERRRERAEELLGSLVTQADRHDSAHTRLNDAEHELYRLSIESAERSLRLGEIPRAKEVLNQHQSAGKLDLRGWEWFHLMARSEGREAFREFSVGSVVDSLAHHPGGELIAFGTADGDVVIWNLREQKAMVQWPASRQPGSPLAWSLDATQMASVRADGAIDVWEAVSGRHKASFRTSIGRVTSMVWDQTGQLQATDEVDRSLRIRDVLTGQIQQTLKEDSVTTGASQVVVAWSADLKLIASGSDVGEVRVWQRDQSGAWGLWRTLKSDRHTLTALAWSPDGQRLAAAYSDETVKAWDVDGAIPMLTLKDVREPLTSLSWNSTGHRLTGATRSGTVCQWAIRTELNTEPGWTSWRQLACAAANQGKLDVAREHCRRICDWAGREGTDALDNRERLLALATIADLLQRHDLLADAIVANEQRLSFNVPRFPLNRGRELPFVATAAQHINDAAQRLLTNSELSVPARRAELTRLLEVLFPYGPSETPIPFRVRPPNAVAATWQVPQIVIELARLTGDLNRLRSEWNRHPMADSVAMLALRAEASAAAGDTATTAQLLNQLDADQDSEPLPLWSDTCVLTPLRRSLTRIHTGFDQFDFASNAVQEYVRKSNRELHIVAPMQTLNLPRLGVCRRQPIQGDFEVSVTFQINDLQQPKRVAGLYLQLNLLEGGEMLHFSRALSRDLGHELVAYQSQVTRDENFNAWMWRFPFDARTGQLILARRGATLYWFFAAKPGQPARLIHAQSCPETEVADVCLFVDYRDTTTQNVVDVLCRDLVIRTSK